MVYNHGQRPNFAAIMRLAGILFSVFTCIAVSSAFAANKPANPPAPAQTVSGKIETINSSRNSISVRMGDATTTFSFDNKTVFTYGQHRSHPQDLKIGDQVIVTGTKGKAKAVNATEQIRGVIESVNSEKRMLLVKVGEETKEIPFDYFLAFNAEGKAASYTDMRAGDSVVLNVNVGLASSHTKSISAKDP